MEIFAKKCYGLKDKNIYFFFSWYEAIIRDFNIFKRMLEKYENSSDKDKLISTLSYICGNLFNDVQEDDGLILKNTPNYFLFSLYDSTDEIPTYVLISKDYKRFMVASEEMECFDDPDYDEDERYGIYMYNYFFLENNKVKHIEIRDKEYTKDYYYKFDTSCFYCEIEEAEKYYNYLLDQNSIVKKERKLMLDKKVATY